MLVLVGVNWYIGKGTEYVNNLDTAQSSALDESVEQVR